MAVASTVVTSDELLLRELAVSLAERFVPLLTTIAQGAAPPREALGLPAVSAPNDGGVSGAGGGRARGVGTSATTAAAAAAATAGGASMPRVEEAPKLPSTAVAARPTTLTGFAAECALALTSVAASVASSPPRLAVAPGGGAPAPTSPNDGGGLTAVPLLFQAKEALRAETCDVAAAATSERSPLEHPIGRSAREATQSQLPQSQGTEAVEGPPNDRAIAEANGEKENEKEDGDEDKEAPTTKRALGVLSALLPASTVPLLGLTEAWLGGGGAEGEASEPAAAAPMAAEGELVVSWDDDGGPEAGSDMQGLGGGLGGGLRVSMTAASNGGGAVAGGPGEARALAVTAVRDLTALVVAGVNMSRMLRERQLERMRVLERDGLEGELLFLVVYLFRRRKGWGEWRDLGVMRRNAKC